jgi:thiamine-phosphate pyrophosphorylase
MADAAPRLYLITPRLAAADAFAPLLAAALEAGDIACVLLRMQPLAGGDMRKIVATLATMAQHHDAAVLVEDPTIAARYGADGVHVAQPGPDLDAALAAMKPDRIVGIGGVASRHDAMSAGEYGVDYVMFGGPAEDLESPLDPAAILERTSWWADIFTLPCVAYAQSSTDVAPLAEAGADFVALGDALWEDPRGVAAAVRAAMLALVSWREQIP